MRQREPKVSAIGRMNAMSETKEQDNMNKGGKDGNMTISEAISRGLYTIEEDDGYTD
jgi:hypothetical protein